MKNQLKPYILALIIAISNFIAQQFVIKSFSLPITGLLYPGTFVAAYHLGFRPTLLVIFFNIIQAPGVFIESPLQEFIRIGTYVVTSIFMTKLIVKARDNESKLQNAIKARDEFLSISSHELRTPLTPLRMQLEGMQKLIIENKDDHLSKMVNISLRQVKRISLLVEDLLDVSRISSGRLTLNLEGVDLAELVEEVCERYAPQFKEKNGELRCTTTSPINALVDRLRFEQILINLLTNALRYSPGTPVEVTLQELSGMAVLKVKDYGIGISREDQERIFERYERGLSSSHYGGLGLGLYIVKQIVHAHHGDVSLSSEINKGSTFVIGLPVRGP